RLPPDVVDGASLLKWCKQRFTTALAPSPLRAKGRGEGTTKTLEKDVQAPLSLALSPEGRGDRTSGTKTNTTNTTNKTNATNNERLIFFSRDDLLNPVTEAVTTADFPDELKLQHLRVPLQYKLEPGEADDGITISVPHEWLNQLDPQRLGWLVPGL